jgi:hypothetical protein
MQYRRGTGMLTFVLTLVLAVINAGDAFGQSQRVEYPPTPREIGFPIVTGPQAQAVEQEDGELARLRALDGQLERQAESLVKQISDAGDGDRAKLKQSLEEALAQQFDTQQKMRELEVAAIEARVKKLREVISKRSDARRAIIDKRLDQLLREADGLGWNSPAAAPASSSQRPPASNFSPYAPTLNVPPGQRP